jgi:molybdenum cofactor cytidylyltransferase
VIAVVLAAGFSRRLGRPKQDVVFEGETLLDRATRIAREVADDVVVVTRENNPDAEEGMASSIRTGVQLAGPDARLLITLCDQPLVTADHLRALIATDAPIVAMLRASWRACGLCAAVRPEPLALRGDRGARHHREARRARGVLRRRGGGYRWSAEVTPAFESRD